LVNPAFRSRLCWVYAKASTQPASAPVSSANREAIF
jgi:hypothetical protein